MESAYRTLLRILTIDGPCCQRQRESRETCWWIYNMRMAHKINFFFLNKFIFYWCSIYQHTE
ncbi:unnamed protein product [Nyctereutes procyonoides]|uniref:(raccoon dog) hypothetical protein n=1 Tax=Nyctereutes procyonoides TaxID=34880 RepID=A0A811YM02_NYCPR|nr:unnamed protein product [Nyctereutes procyonoides]